MNTQRYYNLQVLRIVAAAAIVVLHVGSISRVYFRTCPELLEFVNPHFLGKGVTLFFCISGFVIMHSLQTASPQRFLAARLLRIYPAFWMALAVALALRCACGAMEFQFDARLLRCLSLLPIAGFDEYVLGVEWTLVYEVFFYVTAALLALIGGPRFLLFAGSAWLVACLVRVLYWPNRSLDPCPGFREIWFSGQNIPMLLGLLLYQFRDCGRHLRPFAPALIGVCLMFPFTGIVIGPKNFLIDSVGFALVVWFAATSRSNNADSILVRCGDCSYGVYLVHTTVIAVAYHLALSRMSPPPHAFIYFVGLLALYVGLLFGAAEMKLYRWLTARLLAKRAPVVPINSPSARAA